MWLPVAGLLLGAVAHCNGGERIDALYITSSTRLAESSCGPNLTYGSYGTPPVHVYPVYRDSWDHTCDEPNTDSIKSNFISVPWDQESRSLVWIQDAGVDDSIRETGGLTWFEELETRFRGLVNEEEHLYENGQAKILPSTSERVIVLHKTSTSALLSVPEHIRVVIDSYLPRFMVPVALPASPQHLIPVPDHARERVASILEGIQFNPSISSILSSLSAQQMLVDVRHLTGEDGQGIITRNSFSSGARDAADWIQFQMEHSGAVCDQRFYSEGFSPNVICQFAASTVSSSLVILSAHYDSRGSFGSVRAPGGDDDGSGIALLLAIARAIRSHKVNFKSNVQIVFFSGEEQGLYGSAAYARQLREDDADIVLMVDADMIGYRSPSEPAQVGLPAHGMPGTPEVSWLVGNLTGIYSPNLKVGYTPACCSDHQSFHLQGFPATAVFERAGPIIDPMYHNSGDISNRIGYDMEQVIAIGGATFATLLEAAGFAVGADDV